MKIAVVGTGAIGGYYGAMLSKAGNEVHFLLRSDYDHVRENGLKVYSESGDLHLKSVNAWNDVSIMPKCDLVVITIKATLNHLLSELLPPLCDDNTIVLVLQNGLDVDQEVAQAAPNNTILGGLCAIACNKIGPGEIQHIAYNRINMGQYLEGEQAGITPQLKKISDIFDQAGIPVKMFDDITETRWRKLVWNMTFNGLTTILNCNTREIMDNPGTRNLAESLMKEVITTANANGINIEDSYSQEMIELTDNMGPYLPSMKLDFDAGRELELEVIYERPLIKAKQKGIEAPNLEFLYTQLEFMVAKRN